MAQYIDKATVVAEIEKRIKGLKECHADTVAGYAGEISGLERLLSFLDTLEVKEVDLETTIDRWIYDAKILHEECSIYDTARYFFKLGLKARKGE